MHIIVVLIAFIALTGCTNRGKSSSEPIMHLDTANEIVQAINNRSYKWVYNGSNQTGYIISRTNNAPSMIRDLFGCGNEPVYFEIPRSLVVIDQSVFISNSGDTVYIEPEIVSSKTSDKVTILRK